jgi:hypothetical protein
MVPSTMFPGPRAPVGPARRPSLTARDVYDMHGYVSEVLATIGVPSTSPAHGLLLDYGVRSIYSLERALPPDASLRAVLDTVLRERLAAGLKRAMTCVPADPQMAAACA